MHLSFLPKYICISPKYSSDLANTNKEVNNK